MEELPEEEKPGIPAWVVTFADLMSLLMCFFVLLLSFSEIDAQKFKQIAGEMAKAFGVQRDVPVLEIPEGTSPIFDKFSPAPPEPTLVNEVKQTTTTDAPEIQTLKSPTEQEAERAVERQLQQDLAQIREVLQPAIDDGRINVSENQRRIVIRVEEKGSFPSGSAQITWESEGLLLEMAEVLADMPGELAVEGHTDDIPISTARFQSNWDLSAARAAAVANVLLAREQIQPGRLRVTGLADTEPLEPNTNPATRAKNRRVEIIVDLAGPMQLEQMRLQEMAEQGLTVPQDEPDIDLTIDPPASDPEPQGELIW